MNKNETFKQAMIAFTRANTMSVEIANKCLVDQGIYNKDGSLSKNYKYEK